MTEMTEDFNSVLEQCLGQIGAGKATIWNCLARYPELAGELEPLLLAAEQMWVVPKPVLSSEARARIDVQVFSAVSTSEQHQPAVGQPPSTGRRRGWTSVWRWAATGLAFLAVFFLSFTLVADAVGRTLPGSPLHPVKLAAENTRLWLAPTQHKPKLQLEFARRRLEEVTALIELGDVDASIVSAMTEETEAALIGLAALPPDAAVPLMDDMVALISDQDQALSSMIDGSQAGSQDQVATALEANAAQAARSRSLVSSLPMPPSIAVLAATSLDSVPEPEGEVEYTVQVTNDGAERVTVTSLLSDVRGDLGGQGTCSLPPEGILLSPDESYACTFVAVVAGNADQAQTDTVTAVVVDDEGFEARVSTSATVLVGDVVPVIGISRTANPDSVPEPGGVVEFKVRVTNGGLETVILAGLEDSERGDLNGRGTCSLPPGEVTISPGGVYECTFSARVSGNAGTNNAHILTAIAADDEGNTVQASASAMVSISDVLPGVAVSKTVVPSSVPEPGGTAQCTVRVTNVGVEDVLLDALVDDVHGDLHGKGTCSLAPDEVVISPAETYECSFDARVTGNAGESTTAVVTAIVSDDEGNRTGASDSASVTIADVLPEIDVSRTAEPARVPEPGGKVEFTVRVVNRGPERVELESLVDDALGDLNGKGTCSVPSDGTVVDPGGFYLCSFVSQVSGNADDTWTDVVRAVAADDESNRTRATGSVTVAVTDVAPAISVQKTANPSSVPEPGDAVEFTVNVTNEGVEDVNLLSLLDDIYGDLHGLGTCSLQPDGMRVGPGDSYICSFTAVVSGNPAESQTDTVTAVASDDEGNRARADASTTVTIRDVHPSIAVSKIARPDHVPESGGMVEFTVLVTNNGDEQVVVNVLLDDVHGDLNGQGTCSVPPGEVMLAPGTTYDCSYRVAVSGNAGDVRMSSVTAAVSDDEGNRVEAVGSTAVTATDVPPQIDVSLSAKPDTVPESGEAIRLKVRITNESFEAVNIKSLMAGSSADLNGRGSCSVPEGGILLGPQNSDSPGESYECTFGVTVSGDANEIITRTVHAVAVDDEGNRVKATASDTVTLTDVLPAIRTSQTVEPGSVPEPGGNVTFALRVSNEGTEEITLDALVDDALGDLDGRGTCSVPQTGVAIQPGETYACEVQAGVSGNAGESKTSSVTVVASDDEGNEVHALTDATVTFTDVLPALKVSKVAEHSSVPEPGGGVSFTVYISNEGAEELTLNSMADDVYGDLNGQGTCSVPQAGLSIQGGGSYVCSFQSEIWGNAGVTETGAVTAVASDDEGNEVRASGSATVTISDVLPAIGMSMAASPGSLPEPGGAVLFSVSITNQGIEELFLNSLVDDVHGNLLGQGTCSVPTGGIVLGPGSSYECGFQADVRGNAGQNSTNLVSATASDDEGNEGRVSAGATVVITDVVPAIGVEVSADSSSGVAPGGEVEFSVRVSNVGAEPVTLDRMVDDVYGDLNGQGSCTFVSGETTIGPGDSYECIFAAAVSGNSGDSEVRTVTVVAFDDEGNEAAAVAKVTVVIIDNPESSAAIICQPGTGVDMACPNWVPVAPVAAKSYSLFTSVHQGLRGVRISGSIDHPGTPLAGIPT